MRLLGIAILFTACSAKHPTPDTPAPAPPPVVSPPTEVVPAPGPLPVAPEPPPGPESTPPTLESCREQPSGDQPSPDGEACSWALLAYPYCGGRPPSPEDMWPRCSCELCGVDADCGGGKRCITLPTDDDCHPPKNLCMNPNDACLHGGCAEGEQCMFVGGHAKCKTPTNYPPHP
jgi:hypothetical protein